MASSTSTDYYQKGSYVSSEDGVLCCEACWAPIYHLEMTKIGSRGSVFSGGVVCKNQKQHHWLCNDDDDNTIVTVEYCSRKCAKKKGLEKEYNHYQPWQDPRVPDIDGCGGGMKFRNTRPRFCGPTCKGDCVRKEFDARITIDSDDY